VAQAAREAVGALPGAVGAGGEHDRGMAGPRRGARAAAWHRRCPAYTGPFASVTAAYDVWCTDFKGWFRTSDRQRCDPLTLSRCLQPLFVALRGRGSAR
jgi:hypothetical protein